MLEHLQILRAVCSPFFLVSVIVRLGIVALGKCEQLGSRAQQAMQDPVTAYSLAPISLAGPNALDIRQSEHLKKVSSGSAVRVHACTRPFLPSPLNVLRMLASRLQYLQEVNLYESAAEAENREHVLGQLDRIVKDWVKAVHAAEGYAQSLCEEVNGKIFTFGSYRLGVHGPGEEAQQLPGTQHGAAQQALFELVG